LRSMVMVIRLRPGMDRTSFMVRAFFSR